MKYEGLRHANEAAEMNSKKTKSEQFVIKSLDGGLHYKVVEKTNSLKPQEKIVGHYYIVRPINIPLFILSWLLKLRNRDAYNPSKVYDSKRIVNLGFNPPKTLQQSLDSFIEWHLNQIANNQEK